MDGGVFVGVGDGFNNNFNTYFDMKEIMHYIYLIQDGSGWFKFGRTKEPVSRLIAYNSYNPSTYRDVYHIWGAKEEEVNIAEIEIHLHLKDLGLRQHLREWFYSDNVDTINKIIKKHLAKGFIETDVCLHRETSINYLSEQLKEIRLPSKVTVEEANMLLKKRNFNYRKYIPFALKRLGYSGFKTFIKKVQ